jgi:hypothetical protein
MLQPPDLYLMETSTTDSCDKEIVLILATRKHHRIVLLGTVARFIFRFAVFKY